MSFAPVTVQILTKTALGLGTIDTGTTTLTANLPALISATTAVATADDSTVQEYSTFRFEFINPVPLDTGYIITINFPKEFTIDSKFTQTQAFGFFGSLRTLNFQPDYSQRQVKLIDGIQSYKQSDIVGKLIFSLILNPAYVRVTDTFSIYITDINGFQVAQVTSGITFLPTVGTFKNVATILPTLIVTSITSLTLTFSPTHSLTKQSGLQVLVPALLNPTCTDIIMTGFDSGITCSKNPTSNLFTFTNPFGVNGFNPAISTSAFQITFSQVTLPGSAQPISGFSILTFENVAIAGGSPPIQQLQVDNLVSSQVLFTVQASQFNNYHVAVDTTATYTSATFTFTLQTSIQISAGGKITVILPTEVTTSNVQCNGIQNVNGASSCTVSGQTIVISGAFPTALPKQSTIKFSISGLLTPPSTKTSTSFQIFTMDSNSFAIDKITQFLTVTMLVGKPITQISAQTNSYVVGATTTHVISFRTATPLQNGNLFYLTVPSEINPPIKENLSCLGSGSLNSNVGCQVFGNTITFVIGATSPTLDANSVLTVRIGPVDNPKSFRPSSSYQVVIKDDKGYALCQTPSDNSAKITSSIPGQLSSASISALDPRMKANTTITITATTSTDVPAGGYIQLNYNHIFFEVMSPVSCGSPLSTNLSCEKYYDDNINVNGAFAQILYSNSSISVTINNVVLDFQQKQISNSWSMTTYTSDGYQIDAVTNGLTFQFDCDFPCQTCQSSNPQWCLTCNTVQGHFINYKNKCYQSCPNGLYYDPIATTCKLCDSKCKTCSPENPKICTSCFPDSPDMYLLDGTTCTNTCQFGYYASLSTGKCQACDSTCASCSGSSSNCLTCNQARPEKFQYLNQCYSQCPNGYMNDLQDNICVKCSPNCRTCMGSTIQCTSCSSPYILSLLDNTCVTSCQVGKTIYTPSVNQCTLCDPSCATCSGTNKFCTSCAKNLALSVKSGVCTSQCSADNTLVAVNGICTSCANQCIKCVNEPASCLSCSFGKFMYDYTCLTQCPSGYEPTSEGQCVINGLRCPFGYAPNPTGNACLLKAQACNYGYRINLAKDGCIPAPTYYAPFPLCFCCLILTFMVVGSWIKFRQTLIATNLIAFISVFEVIGILMLVGSSYELGLYSTFGISLVALFFNLGCNLFFCLIFLKQVTIDQAFKHWTQTFRITFTIVTVLGSLISFKLYRFLYGRLFEREHFNAAFEDKESFFKPFTFISIFSLITTMLPVLVASVIGLVFIEYGYQAMMTCIELVIIELALLGLMIYEKCTLKKHVMRQMKYYRMDPKTINSDNVMSGLMDDSSSTFLTQKTKGDFITTSAGNFKEYYERRRHLENLITKMSKKNVGKQEETTLNEIKRMHEEQLLKIEQRNCYSYRDIFEIDEDFADKREADPYLQNFISTPNSPREKEMLRNPFFHGKIVEMKRAFGNDLGNNVYAEAKPAHYFPLRDCKLISIKTQTNLIELLAIDDGVPARRSVFNGTRLESIEHEYVEENVHPEFTKAIIEDVIDTFKEEKYKKKRIRLNKNRLQEIPNFGLVDIMGEFEIDDSGRNLIVESKDKKLNDRLGRRVNKLGYLIDVEGNVITQKGLLIFKKDEIDSDGEIPAPFCFEKKKESLFKIENLESFNKKYTKRRIEDKEEDIEDQYRKLREKNASNRSSVESLMGETPSKYNKKNKRNANEDDFINKLVQPMQAKTKEQLIKGNEDTFRAKNNESDNSKQQVSTKKERTKQLRQNKTIQQNVKTQGEKVLETSSQNLLIDSDSTKDLFFSALSQQNKARPNFKELTSATGTSFHIGKSLGDTNYGPSVQDDNQSMEFNYERRSNITRLRDALGSKKEDEMLLRNLNKFEETMSRQVKEALKAGLAKKNLARVYGKVKEISAVLPSVIAKSTMKNYLEDHEPSTQTDLFRRTGAILGDTKLKDIESIYKTNEKRAGTSMSNKRGTSQGGQGAARFRPLQHSLMETGVETSDPDELRLRNELDRMKAIVEKPSKTATKGGKKSIGHKKQILDGGWI